MLSFEVELCCVLSAFRGFIWALRIVNGERTMLLISIAAKSKLIIVVKFSLDVLIKSKDLHWLPSGFTSLLSSPHVLLDFIKVLSTSGLTSYSNRVPFTNKKNAGKEKGQKGRISCCCCNKISLFFNMEKYNEVKFFETRSRKIRQVDVA